MPNTINNPNAQDIDNQPVPNSQTHHEGNATMDTTTFVNTAVTKTNNTSFVYSLPHDFIKTSYGGIIDQSLTAFLEKPITFATGNFQTTDTFSTFFNTWNMPFSLLTSSAANIWEDKLKGFYGMRMTMKFTIAINGDPFQQGRYILGWVPQAGAAYDGIKTALSVNQHLCSLVQRTTVPHVEVDVNTDTFGELIIPFVSVRNFYNLQEIFANNHQTVLGTLALYPYEALSSPAGSTTVSYTVYASLHDVELFGAASPESGLFETKELANTLHNANTFLKQTKVVSKATDAASKIAKYAGDFVSLFAPQSIASPLYSVAWVMNAARDVAKLHGYSKPTQGDSSMKVTLRTGINHSTVDGDSDAIGMGMCASNGVVAIPGLASTKYDEMSYVSMATRPAWFKTETWALTTPVGSFSSTDVKHYYGIVQSGNDMLQPMSLLTLMHTYVRGGIKIKVKFVKTKFHSGRIAFSFYPTGNGISLTGNPAYVNRWIVDIRTQSEIVLDIPFISDRQWLIGGESFGVLKADIVSALVAPATVPSSIKLIYEVSSLEDIEYALPGPFNQSMIIATPQSGLYDENEMGGNIGESSVIRDPILSTATTVGEKIVSLRAYLRRFFPFRGMQGSVTGTQKFNNYFNSIVTDSIPVLTTSTTDFIASDPYAILSRCFAISRGGTRFRFINGSGNTVPSTIFLNVNSPSSDTSTIRDSSSSVTGIFTGYSRVYQQCTNNSTITVEIPQYSTVFGRATADLWTDGSATIKYKTNGRGATTIVHALPAGISLPVNTNLFENTSVFRSMADDGDLMCFVSVPPVRDVTGLRIGSWSGTLF